MAGRTWRRTAAGPTTLPRTALDIETYPTDAAWDAPYPKDEREPPKNLKDPDKIAAWWDKDQAEWETQRGDAALSWLTGRVAMVALASPFGAHVLEARTEADERDLLLAVQEALIGQRLYTWNGKEFDLRFLVGRMLVRGIAVAKGLTTDWFAKWNKPGHYDVRWGLMGDRWAKGTLKQVAHAFGLPGAETITMTGADVVPMLRAGRWDEVAAYCKRDAQWTYELGARAEGAGLE